MGALITACRLRKRIAPKSCTADQITESLQVTPNYRRGRASLGVKFQFDRHRTPPRRLNSTGGGSTPKEIRSVYENWKLEESALDLDKTHVEKIKKREAEGVAMTKDKFSKYSPLPDIARPPGRLLLRQKTYDVLNPIYVKGPSSTGERKLNLNCKLLPRAKTGPNDGNSTRRPNKRQNELPNINCIKSPSTISLKNKKIDSSSIGSTKFLPKEIRANDLSSNTMVFWCPI